MNGVKLSPPWMTFVNEVKALFADDSDIKIVYDENEYALKLYVENLDKADALTQLLPEKKEFGNIAITITVIAANKVNETKADLFFRAFMGNSALSFTHNADTVMGNFNYVVFRKSVVQFFNDQMNDINGNKSMLYQDIAKDVFGESAGVFFCTDADQKLTKPLGEWP